MEIYSLDKREVLKRLDTAVSGLTGAEAAKRLERYGRNCLREEKKKSLLFLFFAQFGDLMTLILIAAAFLSAVLAFLTGDVNQLTDTAILLFIILLNATVGLIQQYRADAAITKLKKMSVCRAKAVRDGKVILVDAAELVPGDIVEIEEGDRIPADCRVLSSERFRCDESALTGESHPVIKCDCVVNRSALGERENTAHFSTFCVSGRARCVVVATGMHTEMGKIARLLDRAETVPTPLDKTIARLGKLITATVLAVAAVLFIGGLISRRTGFLENLMTAVAVAVAAIPEGMGAVVTIILAMGVRRMSAARAVMRKLSAVETLGNCTCICSDKTGTLTQNRMTVEEIRTDFSRGEEERYAGTNVQRELLSCIRICNTVRGGAGNYLGDPTEIALVEYADRCSYQTAFRSLGGEPFSSERKMMSVAAETQEGRALYVKGGADVLLEKCTRILTESGEREMTVSDRRAITAAIDGCASRAMRVLAFAKGEYRGAVKEEGLAFLGIAAMLDPPREGAKEAVLSCREAGIRTVMITGDHADTAFAIAKRLGIAKERSEVITGEEIDEGGEAVLARVKEFSVFARVSPRHKTEIVRALQKCGEVVAMTGDGVNDAPSVRTADIGVAMGSGTDVTKDAADMVITDDDFSTVVRAAEEGRNVFFNIKRTVCFFLATNLAEVFAVLIATLFLWRYDFLTSTQLLWINLITDSLPVLALGVERTEGAMKRPPVSAEEIFGRRSLGTILFFGIVQTAIVVGIFAYGLGAWGNGAASSAAFFALSFCELFHAFNVRRENEPLGLKGLFGNRVLLITVIGGVAVNVLLGVVPVLCAAFSLTVLTGAQWAVVLLCSAAVVPIGEAYKLILRAFGRRAVRTRGKRIPVRGNSL